jgi:addiction module HigA family antidote
MSQSIAKVGMRPTRPGEFIRAEILQELHLPVTRAAEILRVRRATLSDLVNGKAALSPEMALRIEKAFGVSMDTLLRMQAWHDSHAMRQRAGGDRRRALRAGLISACECPTPAGGRQDPRLTVCPGKARGAARASGRLPSTNPPRGEQRIGRSKSVSSMAV